ncbi:hypothetical protein RYX36_002165 [Vicia faba]
MLEKPLLKGRDVAVLSGSNGAFHHRDIGLPQTTYPMDYMRDAWFSSDRDNKYMNVNMIPTNPPTSYSSMPETSSAHHIQMIRPPELVKEEKPMEKEKKPKRGPSVPKDENTPFVQQTPKASKKTTKIEINAIARKMPQHYESREILVRSLQAMSAGDVAYQVIQQVDKMMKNGDRFAHDA